METVSKVTVNGFEFKVGDKAFKKNKDGEIIFCGWITGFWHKEYEKNKRDDGTQPDRFKAEYVKPFDFHSSGKWGSVSELIHESECGFDDIKLGYLAMCEPCGKLVAN